MAGKKIVFDFHFRLGKKEGNKVRPILLTLIRDKDRNLVLKNSGNLKDHEEYKDIYIKEDLTKSQRDFMKRQEEQLKAEAMLKNSQLKNGEEWEWRIRGRGLMRRLAKVTLQ